MAEFLSPGVYVEEFESGSVPMEGIGTSTAGFIGITERGNIEGLPELVTNFEDFRRKFGGYLSESEFGDYRFLPYAVEHFFINGGSRAFIARVMPSNAECSKAFAPSKEDVVIKLEAKNPGIWGNNLKAIITPASKAKTQILSEEEASDGKKYKVKNGEGFNAGDIVVFTDGVEKIYNIVSKSQDNYIEFEKDFDVDIVDKNIVPNKTISTCEINVELRYNDIVEVYENASFNVQASNFIDKKAAKSELALINYVGKYPKEIVAPFDMINSDTAKDVVQINFMNGSNGSADKLTPDDFRGKDNGSGKRTGIQAFIDNDVVNIMAVPGVTDPKVQLMLVAHCESLGSRFAVLDVPRDLKKVTDVSAHREMFDSNYAAMYHPWLQVFDLLDKKNIFIPPSGSMLGIYARSDNTRGVHKAPANEVVRGCTGLDYQYNTSEQDILSPKGVNLIRNFPGQGIKVWGARTCTSDAQWKYINIRRLFIYIEESIKANTKWVVFEPNDESLWIRVSRTVELFLTTLWRNGALAGTTEKEAFFVNVGRNTMSQEDIDNGRLICEIGVAPVMPSEFIIFKITQKTKVNA